MLRRLRLLRMLSLLVEILTLDSRQGRLERRLTHARHRCLLLLLLLLHVVEISIEGRRWHLVRCWRIDWKHLRMNNVRRLLVDSLLARNTILSW